MSEGQSTKAPTEQANFPTSEESIEIDVFQDEEVDNSYEHDAFMHVPGFFFNRTLSSCGTVTYPFFSRHLRKWYDLPPAGSLSASNGFEEHIDPEHRQVFSDAMALSARTMTSGEVIVPLDLSEGATAWLRILCHPRRLAAGAIQWDCIALDITREKAAETHHALHDTVTGLPTRALFVDWLGQALGRVRSQEVPAFVIALELVTLAEIRESSGFEVGDTCIREAARRLQSAVQFADTIAYTGGGGFLVVLLQVGRLADFTAPLRAIKRQFERRFEHGGQDFRLNIAMGVSVVLDDGDEAETLIGNATTALNRAKESGSAPYQFYDADMTARAVSRLGIDTELRRAIDRNELMLYYQPQFDSQTLELVGLEALIRWRHPLRGLVFPGEFISVAEETGLIVPLGMFALREACRQAREWQDLGITDVPVSVNLSGVQLLQDSLADDVLQTLSDTGLAPGKLKLELTESTLVRNPDAAARTMTRLAEAGVEFSVDDFGIEHSALSHLSRLPIKALKIDYSFVSQVTNSRVHAALVQAIISMTHSMKMSVVAEGVETQEQLTYLRAYQCDVLQGFLLSRPIPPRKIKATLNRHRPDAEAAHLPADGFAA